MTVASQTTRLPERLEQHQLWLETTNVRGEPLVLEGDLPGENLEGVDLRYAQIKADLRGAFLSGAKLNGANLTGAILWDADLSNADLTDAVGLLPSGGRDGISPLSGADLCGAKLPEDVAKFPALDNVAELSKNSGALFLSLITGDAFIQLIVSKTTDLQLLTNSGTTTIPFVNAEIPITTLFWLAPLLLLINFIALHLYLQRLWEIMSSLPAVFPDGLLLTQKSYPWLPNDLVRKGFPQLAHRRQVLAPTQSRLFTLLLYAVIPISLFPIWGTYLKVHNWPMTLWHILCGALFVWWASAFFAIANATLSRNVKILARWKPAFSLHTALYKIPVVFPPLIGAVLFAAFSYLFSLNAIIQERPGVPRIYDRLGSRIASPDFVPRILDELGYRPFVNLSGIEVSIKPDKWEDDPKKDDPNSVRNRAKFNGQDLQCAILSGAFVVHGDLRNARLDNALLRGADLRDADFAGASLIWADLAGANLTGADLTKANLWYADLTGADLTKANLTGANLNSAVYSKDTIFPKGFDPKANEMILRESQ